MTGAATGKRTTGAEAAVAVEGPPASAATTISKMIAEPRFPDFLAISLSLSRQDLSNARRSDLSFEATLWRQKGACVPHQGESQPRFPRSRDHLRRGQKGARDGNGRLDSDLRSISWPENLVIRPYPATAHFR